MGPVEQAAAFEWFDPDSLSVGLMDAERLARYWWAAQAAGGQEVLDAGCGAGQGARILADAGARRVTGVVVSQNAQAEAVRRAGDVADFVTGKFEALPFAPASFDIGHGHVLAPR
ncbi:MAG: class I SAM-dependent methyltransferase [Solirubrobacteraceae bacterium]